MCCTLYGSSRNQKSNSDLGAQGLDETEESGADPGTARAVSTHSGSTQSAAPSRVSLCGFHGGRRSSEGCEPSVSEQSEMKSHISHVSLLHPALLPHTVFNKHFENSQQAITATTQWAHVWRALWDMWEHTHTHTVPSNHLNLSSTVMNSKYLLTAALLILSYSFVL